MSFTAKDVKTLRERTNCGMMDCKKALSASDGNMEKAIELLREKGLAAAAKKAGRIAAEGMVYAAVYESNHTGVIIEVNSETDFVARNEKFQSFVKTCADTISEKNPADVDALLEMQAVGSDMKIIDLLREKILTIGENIKIRRFTRMEGDIVSYIHGGGRIGVLVKFDTDVASKPGFAEYGKDIAMQVAASSPQFLDKESVTADVLAEEKKILKAQAENEGKPSAIAEKMVAGRLSKFYKGACLVEQEFVKDNEISVMKYTQNTAAALGGSIKIAAFARFERGEGLQKREDNFAEEVASMIK